ncbi:probable sucrose-phosphate synthase 1 isoform X2 [Rhodamnia argentea]|uniref:Sucrose-phosphate synthase n=1 Tax=Rhodamnia argentea TaxID=178133 RepID=A0ABM3HA95_9MYRT|nr:probable sucrose-phosphate synthase 1 isoform X2 [Rhodamnia argentea]
MAWYVEKTWSLAVILIPVKYVVELARALGSMPGVYRVDLLTRQISAPDVHWSYGEPTEMLSPRNSEFSPQETGESSGAYIIRIPFGPRDKYVPKELLWPYIPEFVDGALSHITQMSKVLGEQIGGGRPVWPAAIHGHYADAGDAAALLSGALNVPMLFTGHSLGRDKLEQLLKQGRLWEEINAAYKIMRRIEAEELCLDTSEIIVTSTRQEIEEQWRLYDGFDRVLERKLRARIKRGVSCHGRYMPRFMVIPPGMEFCNIVHHDGDVNGEVERNEGKHSSTDPPIWSEIMRFFSNPRKPMILALARPDPKKNITTLVKAYGECHQLRELANLTLIMGNRDDLDAMSTTNAAVVLSILKLIDKYNLYGQVAYPKHHKQSDVPDIYRLAAKTKGVFINPAFIEPFGLTLIEAAAHGLPVVATKNGGPVDILRVLDNGTLVDPHDQHAIANALLKLVSDQQQWSRCRENGLKNIYLFSWPEHCKTYLSRVISCKPRGPKWQKHDNNSDSESDSPGDSLRDIQDISLNLKFSLDGEKSEGNATILEENSDDAKSNMENTVLTLARGVRRGTGKGMSTEKANEDIGSCDFSRFRKRKWIFVIAVDCNATATYIDIIKKIMEATRKEKAAGFILSTALTILEVHSLLTSEGLNLTDFDAFVCSSGSELFYPSSNSDDGPSGLPFAVDLDYRSHIEYRWGGEGLRKTLVRWAASINDKRDGESIVAEDDSGSSSYCFSFKVEDFDLIPPVKELRKLMRIQALRCHVVCSQNGRKINVIPVLASRVQALRYLFVRWGVDLSKFVVFVGECGDTDYEGLIGGAHKTVILKGLDGESRKLHASRSYPLEHVVPFDSPNVVQAEGSDVGSIKETLAKLGVVRS